MTSMQPDVSQLTLSCHVLSSTHLGWPVLLTMGSPLDSPQDPGVRQAADTGAARGDGRERTSMQLRTRCLACQRVTRMCTQRCREGTGAQGRKGTPDQGPGSYPGEKRGKPTSTGVYDVGQCHAAGTYAGT